MQFLKLRWLLNKKIGWVLLWIVGALTLAVSANVLGVHLFGGVQNWQSWLNNNTGIFLLWRILLYTLTACGWLWMHCRLLQREPEQVKRLLRVEICAVAAIVLLEITNWLA
ncbi:hypothetical protein CUZ56_01349 [Saezia sanguinis]|uniref:Uncharacterized protein n=1 Tax=Saezia sanguinis TaxID=1965230 RepID=A0A433SFJ0_9BURK|nr:hypothetical protein [Saezia sanguinis]RUS67404.1 hypothetical protein CUZ56_01349 [Saezia sanguinis]